MSQEYGGPQSDDRPELPIERAFPIERINEIAEKESRAKQWYRPIYTMHKWWARRPGCLFRAIAMYSLLDENTTADDVEVYEPGENQTLGDNGLSPESLVDAIGDVSMDDPEPLWDFYPKDVRIKDKNILDPFMGGGTSLVEASRFGVESVGYDLNPVAWFVTKKQLDAGTTDVEDLEAAFEQVKEDVSEEILQYYRTPCPNGDHEADVMYNFWMKELDCVSCGHTVPLFKDCRVAAGRYENDDKYNVLCPDCGAVTLVDDWRSESECTECHHEFVPEDGNAAGGSYSCPQCGQKYGITDGVQEQGGYGHRLYAVEYYCPVCDEAGENRGRVKGYKKIDPADEDLYQTAQAEWRRREDLHEYVPGESIPEGATTIVRPGVNYDGHDLFAHGYESWTDMFNERQLLCLSTLLRRITEVEDENVKEMLLLAFSGSLRFNNRMVGYQASRHHITNLFKSNGFVPAQKPTEGNLWGTAYGMGSFSSVFENVKRAVEYAGKPTERYITDGETRETAEFTQPIGRGAEVYQGDMRRLTAEDEYDAVITDPPYYDNIIYSELSDYFYVWQKIVVEGRYECFSNATTPRVDSIVTNPYLDKTADDFEHEMGEALEVVRRALTDDGVLAFTYHHSDGESWGELLESLCENGFEVTATYPINSDLNKFSKYEAVSFDIVIIARPTEGRDPISWNALRRRIIRTAKETRAVLEANRELAGGDIGVIEMGKCFQEYSKHHDEVRRGGDVMSAKDVVDEIYGIIQDNTRGEQAIYLDLLEAGKPTYDDLNKHLKYSDASEEAMREMRLFQTTDSDFHLLDWSDETRQAYIQNKIHDDNSDVSVLDKAQFLRYRFEQGKSTTDYLDRWGDDDLRELCEDLATVTGDETYLKLAGVDTSLSDYNG
jgi:adenine-specific DNA methylase